MSAERLDHEAVVAYRRGVSWTTWWPSVAADVERLEPHDLDAYRRLVARLLALVVSGNTNGRTPPGNALVPQTADDVNNPDDTTTNAKIDWARARVVTAAEHPSLPPYPPFSGPVGRSSEVGAREPVIRHGTVSL